MVAPKSSGTRFTPVDKWRTVYWARWLLWKTGLSHGELEIEIRKRHPTTRAEDDLEKSNTFEKYLKLGAMNSRGKRDRTASLGFHRLDPLTRADVFRSHVFFANEVAPGSGRRFCHPFFGLLEEIYFRWEPQQAILRLLKTVSTEWEIADAFLPRKDLMVDRGTWEGLLEGMRADMARAGRPIKLQKIAAMSRLHRVRFQMLRLSNELRRELFDFSDDGRAAKRRNRTISEEMSILQCLSEDPSLDLDCIAMTIAVAMEAGELGEFERRSEAWKYVERGLDTLTQDPLFDGFASNIRALVIVGVLLFRSVAEDPLHVGLFQTDNLSPRV